VDAGVKEALKVRRRAGHALRRVYPGWAMFWVCLGGRDEVHAIHAKDQRMLIMV